MPEILMLHCANTQCRVQTFTVAATGATARYCPSCYGQGQVDF